MRSFRPVKKAPLESTMEFSLLQIRAPVKKGDVVISALAHGEDSLPFVLDIAKEAQEIVMIGGNKGHLDLDLSGHGEWQEYFAGLDEFLIEQVYRNSEEWFGKAFPLAVVKEFYTPILRQQVLRVKVPIRNALPVEEITVDGKPLMETMDFLSRNQGHKLVYAVEFRGIRFNKQTFAIECFLKRITHEFCFTRGTLPDVSELKISSGSNIDKFLQRRESYLRDLQQKKEELETAIREMERKNEEVTAKILEIDREVVDNTSYDYSTDDEFLEEEIDAVA